MRSSLGWLDALTTQTVDARWLAWARIVIGTIALVSVLFDIGPMIALVLQPDVAALPLLPGLPRLSLARLPLWGAVGAGAALLLVLGVVPRLAGVVLSGLLLYAMLLDQQTYSNHGWLLLHLVALLSLGDSAAVWSLTARWRGVRPLVAYWPLCLIKVQIALVYGFAAITKLNPQFLSGQMLIGDLAPRLLWLLDAGPPERLLIGSVVLAAWLTVAIELLLAVGLWLPRLRRISVLGGIALHSGIVALVGTTALETFQLGLFALLLIGLYPLFSAVPQPAPSTPTHCPPAARSSADRDDRE